MVSKFFDIGSTFVRTWTGGRPSIIIMSLKKNQEKRMEANVFDTYT